ncbi:hypothetical protein ACFXDH_15460 [Streptomyces sp. NPDC059467]|uniref:hypothetical protein n=1 Tax=Streptomyces sp. NPDC059467 TaxID=3346844 RepID=UPI00367BE34D
MQAGRDAGDRGPGQLFGEGLDEGVPAQPVPLPAGAVAAAGPATTAGMAGVDAVPAGLGPYLVTGDYGFSPRAFAKQRLDS